MNVMTGFCKYCGQAIAIETEKELDQEALDNEASMKCECEAAKVMKKREENRRIGLESVRCLFEDMPDLAEFLQDGVNIIAENRADSISVDTGMGVQGKLKATKKGTVRVTRIEKEKREME
jgi:biotin synthase-like enzyme